MVFGPCSLLFAQSVATSALRVSFNFVRPVPGVPVPRYTIQINGDGTGAYRAELATKAPSAGDTTPVPVVEKALRFSPATLQAVADGLQTMHTSHAACEAVLKNIADTGTKRIEYKDALGEGTCSYNYSENKGVVRLTEIFQGIEQTLEAGRALEFKHRYDRLGLDAEMITLGASVDSGRAVALETIGGTLRSIAADTELIERVRLRAAKLVERTADTR